MAAAKATARRDRDALRVYGCAYEEAVRLNGGLTLQDRAGKATRYRDQRHSSLKREIAWEMTLAEWIAIWEDSGMWALRGTGKGCYCMAREGDSGSYRIGNVRIARNEENWAESGPQRRGWTVKGYSRLARSKARPFTVRHAGKVIGHFATEHEAAAAYAAVTRSTSPAGLRAGGLLPSSAVGTSHDAITPDSPPFGIPQPAYHESAALCGTKVLA